MIYVFLANGFEEIEALSVVDILRRAELNVTTVGVGGTKVNGAHGITVVADIEDKSVTTDNMQGVVLPGGMPGTLNLEKSPIVKAAINYCRDNNKRIMAICAAPSIIGHMGLLNGKKAVCYPGFENELAGASLGNLAVEVDGNIITSKGPGTAIEFALEIVKEYKDAKTAKSIKDALQCQ